MRKYSRVLTIGLCVGIGVVAALMGAAFLRDSGSAEPEKYDSSLLLTGNRERLQVCIEDLVEESATDSQKQAAEDALSRLEDHENWRAAGLDKDSPVVVVGCNAEPFLLSSGVSYENGGFSEFAGFPEVKEPSKSRVMIFVLPDKQIDSMFGDSPLRIVGQEALCEGGQCATVTAGLYLKSSELTSADLERSLAFAIGLERVDLSQPDESETEEESAP
jgi:hypothetical protein